MQQALEHHDTLKSDDEARDFLLKYFRYTGHYIVAASEYMRPDQVRFEWGWMLFVSLCS